jgi:hypothetical protein
MMWATFCHCFRDFQPSSVQPVLEVPSTSMVSQGQGHQGLADAVGIVNNWEWRGFVVTSDGRLSPASHFNLIDGSLRMNPSHENAVRQDLQQAGLLA